MSKFKSLIKTYEDFELAFLWKFRYKTLMSFTREILDEELASRNLTPEKMEKIVMDLEFTHYHDSDGYACRRCTSRKAHNQSVENFRHDTNPNKINVRVCSVCGYSDESTEVRDYSLWEIFRKFFRI